MKQGVPVFDYIYWVAAKIRDLIKDENTYLELAPIGADGHVVHGTDYQGYVKKKDEEGNDSYSLKVYKKGFSNMRLGFHAKIAVGERYNEKSKTKETVFLWGEPVYHPNVH